MSDSDSSHNVPSLAELDDFRAQVSHLATEVLHALCAPGALATFPLRADKPEAHVLSGSEEP
jgi:hypothetical protein